MRTKLITLLFTLAALVQGADAAKLQLNWGPPAGSTPTGHIIQRSAGNTNNFSQAATTGNVTTWTDTNGVVSTVYFYRLMATNAGGNSAWSNIASGQIGLPTVAPLPLLIGVSVGQPLNIQCTATGTAPISYQWRLNGVIIPGATSATYSVAAVTSTTGGNYDVVVTDAISSVTSTVCVVAVMPNPPVQLTVTLIP